MITGTVFVPTVGERVKVLRLDANRKPGWMRACAGVVKQTRPGWVLVDDKDGTFAVREWFPISSPRLRVVPAATFNGNSKHS